MLPRWKRVLAMPAAAWLFAAAGCMTSPTAGGDPFVRPPEVSVVAPPVGQTYSAYDLAVPVPAESRKVVRAQDAGFGGHQVQPLGPASRPIDPRGSQPEYQNNYQNSYPSTLPATQPARTLFHPPGGSGGTTYDPNSGTGGHAYAPNAGTGGTTVYQPGVVNGTVNGTVNGGVNGGIGTGGPYAPLGPGVGTPGQPAVYPYGVPPELVNPPPDRPIPLDVWTEEHMTGRFMFGVGVNSDAGVTGNIVIDEQNFDWRRFPGSWSDFTNGTAFRGGGQRFTIEALPGDLVQRYSFRFREPYLNYSRVSLGLSAQYYDRRFFDWDEKRGGGSIDLGYNLTPDLSASVSVRAATIDISNPRLAAPELTAVVGDNTLVGFGVRLRHDTRDSAFLATQGHLIELSFEQVVGTFVYPRFDVDMRKYFRLRERIDGSGAHVLALSGRLGVAGEDTPIYEHYFAGGFSTLRGFEFREASPKFGGPTGVVVGGEFMALGSVEYMFPITQNDMVRGVVFCDFGTVERTSRLDGDNFRAAPGAGLRITVPAMGPAPIALDFAFPVLSAPDDEERVFSFFVGFNR